MSSILNHTDLNYALTTGDYSLSDLYNYIIKECNCEVLNLHYDFGISVSSWIEQLKSYLGKYQQAYCNLYSNSKMSVEQADMWQEIINYTDLKYVFNN